MSYAKVPAFMKKLVRLENSVGRDGLKLTVLTAVRSNETRFAKWSEFDLEAGTWSIPRNRMKMKVPHVVPLSSAALGCIPNCLLSASPQCVSRPATSVRR